MIVCILKSRIRFTILGLVTPGTSRDKTMDDQLINIPIMINKIPLLYIKDIVL